VLKPEQNPVKEVEDISMSYGSKTQTWCKTIKSKRPRTVEANTDPLKS